MEWMNAIGEETIKIKSYICLTYITISFIYPTYLRKTQWRLNKEEINLCFSEIKIEHFIKNVIVFTSSGGMYIDTTNGIYDWYLKENSICMNLPFAYHNEGQPIKLIKIF